MRRSLVLAVMIALAAPAAAEARTSISKAPVRTVRAGQGTIGYRSVGHGRALVLIMGLAGTMNAWEPSFVDALAASHRVVTFDNEGIGASTLGTGTLTIRRMGRDTASLIKALRLRNPDLVGWSMGGMIAQALVHERPRLVRRLILCATAPGDAGATFPSADALGKLTGAAPDLGGVLGLLFPAGHQAATQAFIAGLSSYTEGAAVAPTAVVTQQLSASASWLAGTDPAGRPLRRLTLPVLVGAGALDQLLPVANDRHLASALPHAHLRVYPDAAHGFLVQDQANFLPAVISFLR